MSPVKKDGLTPRNCIPWVVARLEANDSGFEHREIYKSDQELLITWIEFWRVRGA